MQWIQRVQFKGRTEFFKVEIHPAAWLSGFEGPGGRRKIDAMHAFGDEVIPVVRMAEDERLYLFAWEDDVVDGLESRSPWTLGRKSGW